MCADSRLAYVMRCRLAELLLQQRDEMSPEEASSTGTSSYSNMDSDPYELTEHHQYDNTSTRSSMSSSGSVDDDIE